MAKKVKKISTQSEDMDNIFRYLKNARNNSQSYEKYLSPMIKQKGRQYVDKLLGSTIIVLSERGLTLDNIDFDENGNLTVLKGIDVLTDE